MNDDVDLHTLGFLISKVGMITASAWRIGGAHSVTYSESGMTPSEVSVGVKVASQLILMNLVPVCIS